MNIARHTILLLATAAAVACAFLVGRQHIAEPDDQFMEILFCATCVLAVSGALASVLQFVVRQVGSALAYVFFGFFAGLMATNFASEVVSGTRFSDVPADFGLMILLFAVSVAGITLIQITDKTQIAEQHARQVSSEAAPSASPDEPSA